LKDYATKYYNNNDEKLSAEEEQQLIQQCSNYWIDDEDEQQPAALCQGDVVTHNNITLCGVIDRHSSYQGSNEPTTSILDNPDIDDLMDESFQWSCASNDGVQQSPHTPDPMQNNTLKFTLPTPDSSSRTSTNESTPSNLGVSTIASAVTPGA
jgi:hypothetical protein